MFQAGVHKSVRGYKIISVDKYMHWNMDSIHFQASP